MEIEIKNTFIVQTEHKVHILKGIDKGLIKNIISYFFVHNKNKTFSIEEIEEMAEDDYDVYRKNKKLLDLIAFMKKNDIDFIKFDLYIKGFNENKALQTKSIII